MAITLSATGVDRIGWISNGTSADASGAEIVKAAEGSGTFLILDHVTISCTSAITVTIGGGETGGAVTSVLAGPLSIAANTTINIPFKAGAMLADNTALVVDASGGGVCTVVAQGRTKT